MLFWVMFFSISIRKWHQIIYYFFFKFKETYIFKLHYLAYGLRYFQQVA